MNKRLSKLNNVNYNEKSISNLFTIDSKTKQESMRKLGSEYLQ